MKMIKLSVIFITFLGLIPVSGQSNHSECPTGRTVMPARYFGHRFIVEPITSGGKKLSFYTDTGGGLFIHRETAQTLKLLTKNNTGQEPVDLPKFRKNMSIPKPLGSNGKLYVLKKNPKSKHFINQLDGMLGQAWFADRVWIFDYPNKRLILDQNQCHRIRKSAQHSVKLGFKTNDQGKRLLSFPRIRVEIDGEVIDLLFDTGATTSLTEKARQALKDEKKVSRATSFITASVFEKWRKNKPDWRVIEKAEENTGEAIIEVPKMKIAGHEIGPVWFTRRADKNFHEYMTKFMDKKIEGAIGGNGLKFFKVTVDYPRALALFEKKK